MYDFDYDYDESEPKDLTELNITESEDLDDNSSLSYGEFIVNKVCHM